ncbi:MAG: DNA polymerase I [Candidatus Omnitrophota bacterium]
MSKKDENIYLIDGNAFCYRAYYAIRDLATSKGEPTNAIYGFINIIRKLRKEHDPQRLVMVFDMPGPTVRHKKYDEYKIHRKPMPDDLAEQISKIKEVVEAMNITICQLSGYEADDIIATLTEKAKENGMNVVIVTSDKDALQLVDKDVSVLSLSSFGEKTYKKKEVEEKYGVTPDKITELMALTGDSSDNIPGVKGIGKVGAAKLINEYGSIDNIYANMENMTAGSTKDKLVAEEDMARLSKELVVLDSKVPIDIDLDKTFLGEPDSERLAELYKKFEFKKLLGEIATVDRSEIGYTECKTEEDVKKALKGRTKNEKIFFSTVPEEEKDGVKGVSLTIGEKTAFIPLKAEKERDAFGKELKNIFEDDSIEKVGWDIKRQILFFRREGIEVKGKIFDIMVADYLLDPSAGSYDFRSILQRSLGTNMTSDADVVKKTCIKSHFTKDIYGFLEPLLKEKELNGLFEKVEMPLIKVLADMESHGVDVDSEALKKGSKKIEKDLEKVTHEIYELAGEEFNINSPKQMQIILYDKLSLPVIKKTKTGRSTDESVLRRLASMHALPVKLIDYREMNKLKTGYYDTLLGLASANDGKIFAKFNQAVTATGRLSSSDPNLQNIPIKTALGKEIRRAFISGGADRILIAADYSQVELRILAHLAEDKKLIKAFNNGEDVHRVTAGKIFDRSLKEVTDEQRSAAKTVNFGIIYGISAFGLAKELDITIEEAQKFIDAYFSEYGETLEFIERIINETRKNGFVSTLLKRRRYIPEIKSENDHVRKFAERAAVNTAVQGSAADIIKLAMIDCYKKLKEQDVKLIIQVHDELVFDVPRKHHKEITDAIRVIMENVMTLKVPLKVDIGSGENWLEAK